MFGMTDEMRLKILLLANSDNEYNTRKVFVKKSREFFGEEGKDEAIQCWYEGLIRQGRIYGSVLTRRGFTEFIRVRDEQDKERLGKE